MTRYHPPYDILYSCTHANILLVLLQVVLREAALHSVLSHPNILTVYSWETEQLGGGNKEVRSNLEFWDAKSES